MNWGRTGELGNRIDLGSGTSELGSGTGEWEAGCEF